VIKHYDDVKQADRPLYEQCSGD